MSPSGLEFHFQFTDLEQKLKLNRRKWNNENENKRQNVMAWLPQQVTEAYETDGIKINCCFKKVTIGRLVGSVWVFGGWVFEFEWNFEEK